MRKPDLRIGVGLALALAMLGGVFALRIVERPGRAHELARRLYHTFSAASRSPRAYADASPSQRAAGPLTMYDDALGSGWQDWSWASHELASARHTHSGKCALAMTPASWKGVYLHHDALSTAGYGSLEVFVHGSSALNVRLVSPEGQFGAPVPLARYCQASPSKEGWVAAQIPLTDLASSGGRGVISGVVFQAASADSQPEIFLDDISLQPDSALPPADSATSVAVRVDVTADQHTISPLIYGMAFAPPAYLTDLRVGLNRWGGNHTSRYNWVHGNACNSSHDWRWANRTAMDRDISPVDSDIPPGPSSAADRFIALNRSGKTPTLLTVPTLGWVACDADHDHCSLNVPEHGGAPCNATDGGIAGYDPAENRQRTSLRSVARKGSPFSEHPATSGGVVYQDEWIHHLVERFGSAAEGGAAFYAMDNEPDLWDSTHTDVHPARMGYDDLLANFLEYATAVKAVDATAQVTGPVSWGWSGYLYSALDRGDDNFRTHADRSRHGGEPFLLWFLKQVRAHDLRTGKRTLDVLDVHFYPQGSGLFAGSLDADAQLRRLRAPRALWDPTYADESWIAEPVRLIPRLREWIAAGYPGTQVGISEWNMGADDDINGALAIADTLGIYGREGVFLANYWKFPPPNSPGYLAFKLYRNADREGHGFGDASCRATSADAERVACFAATDTPTGDLTLLLVNKMRQTTAKVPVQLAGCHAAGGATKVWRLSASDPHAIVAEAGPPVRDGSLVLALPPSSVTLVRVRTQRP